jgi:hypothetical protein
MTHFFWCNLAGFGDAIAIQMLEWSTHVEGILNEIGYLSR